ncbi:MAG: tetratricopeptide repeat protein [Actinomycetota bacterium]
MDLVLDQAHADWRLRERLAARAAAAAGAGIDERGWRRRLETAFAPNGEFVDYDDAPTWAAGVTDVIDALEELVDAGHAGAVIPLAEHAHRLADAAIQHIDDSDGWLSDISSRLGALHLRACEVGSPNRIELARRLADLELTSDLDAFHRGAATYAEVLGADGIAEYRRKIEPNWRGLGPETDRWSTDRFRVQEAMTGVALAVSDPDELARVKEHDLRTPDGYHEIADSLRSVGRVDDAIDWARRGLDAYASRSWQTPPLRELLAEMLRDRGDLDGAVDAFWQAFELHPSVEAYRWLLTEADRAGHQREWKQRALKTLRVRVAERRPDDATASSIVTVTPAAALIEILLYEGDVDGAWETATTVGCTDRLWLTLARAREDDHPLEVIPIYERDVFAQIDTKKNQGYRNAVKHLARIRTLSARGDEPERFERLLAEVRTRHKPKRNLMALLDDRGW